MISSKDLIIEVLNNIKNDLVGDLHSKNLSDGDLGMTVSGSEVTGELKGASYYWYLVHGRKPGKQPPIDNILQWLHKKGMAAKDISERSLAYLIARKIGQQGTDIYQGKRPGLALEQIVKHNTEQFTGDLKEKYRNEITETIASELKKLFV